MMKCQVMLKTSHVIEEGQRVLWVNRVGPSQKGPNGILTLHWVGMHNTVNNSSTHMYCTSQRGWDLIGEVLWVCFKSNVWLFCMKELICNWMYSARTYVTFLLGRKSEESEKEMCLCNDCGVWKWECVCVWRGRERQTSVCAWTDLFGHPVVLFCYIKGVQVFPGVSCIHTWWRFIHNSAVAPKRFLESKSMWQESKNSLWDDSHQKHQTLTAEYTWMWLNPHYLLNLRLWITWYYSLGVLK